MNCWRPLIDRVKAFKNADAYIVECIENIVGLPQTLKNSPKIKTPHQVSRLLWALREHTL